MGFERNSWLKVALIVFSIVVIAILGSVFVNIGMDWFDGLNTPSQWIPNIVIPIVWTLIYLIFGIVLSVWVVKDSVPKNVIFGLILNGILNVLWCLVFFTLHLTFVGNILIVFNLIAGIILFLQIYKVKELYAIITSIYPLWLSLATTLNLALWILN